MTLVKALRILETDGIRHPVQRPAAPLELPFVLDITTATAAIRECQYFTSSPRWRVLFNTHLV